MPVRFPSALIIFQTLVGHPALAPFATARAIAHDEYWISRLRAGPVVREIPRNDLAGYLWQRHRLFRAAFAFDTSQAEVRDEIIDVERHELGAAQGAVSHERKHGSLPTICSAFDQLLELCEPGRPWKAALSFRPGQEIERILFDAFPADGPLTEASERRETDANRVCLQPAPTSSTDTPGMCLR